MGLIATIKELLDLICLGNLIFYSQVIVSGLFCVHVRPWLYGESESRP